VGLTVVRGESFTNGTFVVIASGWIENTGMKWKDANKDSVGNQWGNAPTRIEVVPWTLRLPVPAERLRGWILDERGQRRRPMSPQTNGAGFTRLSAPADAATLWYEVEVAPPTLADSGGLSPLGSSRESRPTGHGHQNSPARTEALFR
jgi:hypothetical protein